MPSPYHPIVCPDGYTYDVRDNSPYVKACVVWRDSIVSAKFQACIQDPACREAHLQQQRMNDSREFLFMSITSMVGLFLMLFLIKILKTQ